MLRDRLKSLALGLLLIASVPAMGQTAGLLVNGKQTFVDSNGIPLAGGKVYFYIPSTTTPKTTWVDPAEATPNANPVVLDSAGRAIIYGSGQYRELLRDQYGNTIWDQLTAFSQSPCTAFGTTAGTCTQGNDSRFLHPYVSVYLTTTQSYTAGGNNQKVAFDTVEFDSNGWWDAANHRYTPQVAGVYRITTVVQDNGTGITSSSATFFKNGSLYKGATNTFTGSTPTLNFMYNPISAEVSMNGTTDYIEVDSQIGGATGAGFFGVSSATISTWFDAEYIGP